jgi:hypothetical protein
MNKITFFKKKYYLKKKKRSRLGPPTRQSPQVPRKEPWQSAGISLERMIVEVEAYLSVAMKHLFRFGGRYS